MKAARCSSRRERRKLHEVRLQLKPVHRPSQSELVGIGTPMLPYGLQRFASQHSMLTTSPHPSPFHIESTSRQFFSTSSHGQTKDRAVNPLRRAARREFIISEQTIGCRHRHARREEGYRLRCRRQRTGKGWQDCKAPSVSRSMPLFVTIPIEPVVKSSATIFRVSPKATSAVSPAAVESSASQARFTTRRGLSCENTSRW